MFGAEQPQDSGKDGLMIVIPPSDPISAPHMQGTGMAQDAIPPAIGGPSQEPPDPLPPVVGMHHILVPHVCTLDAISVFSAVAAVAEALRVCSAYPGITLQSFHAA